MASSIVLILCIKPVRIRGPPRNIRSHRNVLETIRNEACTQQEKISWHLITSPIRTRRKNLEAVAVKERSGNRCNIGANLNEQIIRSPTVSKGLVVGVGSAAATHTVTKAVSSHRSIHN